MNDSISRQDAIDALHKKRIETMKKGQDVNLIWECLDVVAQVPTADVAPVVHGKWENGVCGKCGFDWGKVAPIASVPNFCPQCGAKMDL